MVKKILLQYFPLCLGILISIKENTVSAQYQANVSFYVNALAYNSLQIQYEGEKILKSRACFSFETGLLLEKTITNKWSIKGGIGYTLVPYNINYNFQSPIPNVMSDNHDLNSYDYALTQFTFPLLVRRYFMFGKHSFLGEVGVKLHRTIQVPYEISGGASYYINDTLNDIRVFDMHIQNASSKWMLSGLVKLGYEMGKDRHRYQINMFAQYSPQYIGRGNYYFSNLPYQSKGNVMLGVNCIGIEFRYSSGFWKKK